MFLELFEPFVGGWFITRDIIFGSNSLQHLALKFFPLVLLLELPFYLLVVVGVIKYVADTRCESNFNPAYCPKVSCGLLCYSEGRAVQRAILSLLEQIYPGHIQIIVVIDGAIVNAATAQAVEEMRDVVTRYPNRSLLVVPKRQRGGRVSSLNTILTMSEGEIVMALDGDTSFDNVMVQVAVPSFADKNVVAVAGNLRVRNGRANLVTRLQAIEYMLAIHLSKVALSEFNVINNISGAFGIFRRDFLEKIGGWDAGTAEDLDLTLRIKSYFKRHPKLRIVFHTEATGHTDAPETVGQLLDQRLRWDGDLLWLYMRKHPMTFNPKLVGVKNFIFLLWAGLLFQIMMPFLIILYTIYGFFVFSAAQMWGMYILIYSFYLLVTLILFILYLATVSDRVKEDFVYLLWVPLFPFYSFAIRIWAAISSLTEIFFRSSQYTSMAPWWVTKRNKF